MFFEPPELYEDIAKYAYALKKSGNIKEKWKVAKTLQDDLKNGRFESFQKQINDGNYRELIAEINSEIHSLEKTQRYVKLVLQFAAHAVGTAAGALVGRQFGKPEMSLLFSFLGATAAAKTPWGKNG